MRHGTTEANRAGRWQGWSDSHLSPLGHAEAKEVARRLAAESEPFSALFTSPLRRARQTARAIALRLNLDPTPVEMLKEVHFGELEGKTLKDFEAGYPALHARWQDKRDLDFRWPGGERRGDFFRRASEACQRIVSDRPGERVIVVAHGGTIRACLAGLLPRELGQWWDYELSNAGLTRVDTSSGDARLIMLNDTEHLGAL